jgi:hypothetical protein
MRSKLLQGAGFLMSKANRVHCTPRRTASKIQIKNGRRLPFFNDKDHCTSDVKPTGDYAADCETGEP